MRRWLVLVPLALLAAPLTAEEPARKNVLLITADTLRAQAVEDTYTPHLDHLAAEGVRFDRAYTPITTTLPAHASIFTSLYPRDHRAYSNVSRLSSKVTTLAEVLDGLGWETACHINMPWLNPDASNVPQGFRTIRRGDRIRKADKTNPWVIDFLAKEHEDPWLLWVHYVDNHTPYHAPGSYDDMYTSEQKNELADVWRYFPPDHQESEHMISWLDGVEYAEEVVDDYHGSATWIDAHVGQIVWELKRTGQWDDTLVVFTSDHGESMGEHDLWFVHAGLFEQTTRVPLIVRDPGGPAGVEVDTVVSTIDVMPTVLNRLSAPTPDGVRGADLWQVLDADGGGVAYLEHTGRQLTGVVTERWKYIRHDKTNRIYSGYPMNAGTLELYDLSADPDELVNLAAEMPDRVAELEALMTRLEAGERGFEELTYEVDEDMREALRAMGYVE
ncbi:MAG TPA: sulfatase [Myxococcota bacterium]|nr:sulfatase [Myxococcota bacterium]